MTLRELYDEIGGNYDMALKVLRMEKLVDKHIRKLAQNTIFNDINTAAEAMDAPGLFESAHAIKGVCANLGLVELAEAASEICEEFRPERERKLTDAQALIKVHMINELYKKAVDAIARYERS